MNRLRSVTGLVAVGLGALIAVIFPGERPGPEPSAGFTESDRAEVAASVGTSTDAATIQERFREVLLSLGRSPHARELEEMTQAVLRIRASRAALLELAPDAHNADARRRLRDEIARAHAEFARAAGMPLSALISRAVDGGVCRQTRRRGRGIDALWSPSIRARLPCDGDAGSSGASGSRATGARMDTGDVEGFGTVPRNASMRGEDAP